MFMLFIYPETVLTLSLQNLRTAVKRSRGCCVPFIGQVIAQIQFHCARIQEQFVAEEAAECHEESAGMSMMAAVARFSPDGDRVQSSRQVCVRVAPIRQQRREMCGLIKLSRIDGLCEEVRVFFSILGVAFPLVQLFDA